jgi:hypothetical protein
MIFNRLNAAETRSTLGQQRRKTQSEIDKNTASAMKSAADADAASDNAAINLLKTIQGARN